MRHILLLVLTFLQTSLPAVADEFRITGIEPGTVLRFATDNGNARITYRGPDQGMYLFQYERDASKGSPRKLLNWTDALGRTKIVIENGKQLRFSPHDCWLVEGRCLFTVTNSDGDTYQMAQIGKLDGNRFIYELRNPRKTVENGQVRLDKFGMPLERRYTTADGKTHWTKRK